MGMACPDVIDPMAGGPADYRFDMLGRSTRTMHTHPVLTGADGGIERRTRLRKAAALASPADWCNFGE
jgi:hypothetical protein